MVCACPTTERNLGDGVVPADEYFKHDVPICLGTDSHAQIDLLEDARELEYHLRLQKLERAVLSSVSTVREGSVESYGRASELLCYSIAPPLTARAALVRQTARLNPERPRIFSRSLSMILQSPARQTRTYFRSIVFSLSRAAVREVVVSGKPIVSEGQHLVQEEVVERFKDLQKRLWN